MNERDEIAVMLITVGFFGTSFWPVLLGWVDLLTLSGWIELVANFLTTIGVIAAMGTAIATGWCLARLSHWAFRAALVGRSRERAWVAAAALGVAGALWRGANRLWKAAWWTAWFLGKPAVQQGEPDEAEGLMNLPPGDKRVGNALGRSDSRARWARPGDGSTQRPATEGRAGGHRSLDASPGMASGADAMAIRRAATSRLGSFDSD